MLEYTGHPIVDVGMATIAAFAGRRRLRDVSQEDLDKIADYLESEYPKNPLKSFLGVAFTMNAWFNQPAFDSAPEKRKMYADRLLRGYRSGRAPSRETCVFTGKPAVGIAFSDKLPPGRAYRQHVPLITGEGAINFFPSGDAGLPVSAEAILAIQAFPLGCAKVGGRLLAVHSDDPELMQDFAAEFLDYNLRAISIAQSAGSTKMPEARASARTLLVETLLKVERRRHDEASDGRPASVTAYHLSNSGQSNPLDPNNPPLDIYHLPLQLTRFLSTALSPVFREDWTSITQRAWQMASAKRSSKTSTAVAPDSESAEGTRRNLLYEDLFHLPENARSFVRVYFLRTPVRSSYTEDPRRGYSLREESNLVSWKLTELFLKEVMEVDKDRIREIRELGDRLAAYVSGENDRKFFTSFFAEQDYGHFRNALIKANLAHVKRGNPPLITLDPYVEVFEEGDEVARPDWRLARDLVLIRMIEGLYKQGWLSKNKELLPEAADEATGDAGDEK